MVNRGEFKIKPKRWIFIIGLVFLICTFGGKALIGEIRFKEVTGIMDKECTGPSWGGAWGDYDGDGYADLWLTNHSFGKPFLFHNQRGQGFREVSDQVLRGRWKGDRHGAMWTDFENDGDQDLIQLTGGGRGLSNEDYPKLIYVNQNGLLEESSEKLGLSNPQARCRDPFWLDMNNDGLLDLIQAAAVRPDGKASTAAWTQVRPGVFKEITDQLNPPGSISFLQLWCSEPKTRDPLRILCFAQPTFCILNPYLKPLARLPVIALEDNKSQAIYGIWDSVSADFDGDIIPEIFIARGGRDMGILQEGEKVMRAKLKSPYKENHIIGLEIETWGPIQITFEFYPFSLQSLFIGRDGHHPSSGNFSLSPTDLMTHGIPGKLSPVELGVYIGWEAAAKRWRLILPKGGPGAEEIGVHFVIKTSQTIRSWKALGFENDLPAPPALLLRYQKQAGENVIFSCEQVPLGDAVAYSSVIAGDFDNDMDVDLYVVGNCIAGNAPNLLLENTGAGTFRQVPQAGGARGSQEGIGESAMSADFNNDGFLDFVLTNGTGVPVLCEQGKVQLYRNVGNANHWIELDLQGTVSNRDGIGAQLWLTTPDNQTQYRLASGGKHNRAQDFSRLHFGLGKNRSVTNLVIRWPAGTNQVLTGLSVDRIYRVVEKATKK